MDLMPNIHFNKGEIIFEEGYPADSVYLVCEGEVEVFKRRDNQQINLATLGKDAIFGEMAFISERPRSATVVAKSDAWCFSINEQTFKAKLAATDKVIVNIYEDLAETIRNKSNAAVIIDHGNIHDEPLDELEMIEAQHNHPNITPQYTYEYVSSDPRVTSKVEELDFFMRMLFNSLVNIAYKNT